MLFQWRASVEDRGSTLKQYWVNATSLFKVYSRPSDGLVFGQRRKRLTGIKPATEQRATTLAQHWAGIWWVGLHPLYEVHRRQVLNECWPAPAMVVEGIHVKDILELVSLVLFSIIFWTFRKTNTILGGFFVYSTREFGNFVCSYI